MDFAVLAGRRPARHAGGDLAALADRGLLNRVYGGAVRIRQALVEAGQFRDYRLEARAHLLLLPLRFADAVEIDRITEEMPIEFV